MRKRESREWFLVVKYCRTEFLEPSWCIEERIKNRNLCINFFKFLLEVNFVVKQFLAAGLLEKIDQKRRKFCQFFCKDLQPREIACNVVEHQYLSICIHSKDKLAKNLPHLAFKLWFDSLLIDLTSIRDQSLNKSFTKITKPDFEICGFDNRIDFWWFLTNVKKVQVQAQIVSDRLNSNRYEIVSILFKSRFDYRYFSVDFDRQTQERFRTFWIHYQQILRDSWKNYMVGNWCDYFQTCNLFLIAMKCFRIKWKSF